MRVVSLSVGGPREVEWNGETVLTSILKAPVDRRLPVTALNIAGVKGANRFNLVMTIAKLLPLLLLVVVGLGAVHRENLAWTATPALGEVGRALELNPAAGKAMAAG